MQIACFSSAGAGAAAAAAAAATANNCAHGTLPATACHEFLAPPAEDIGRGEIELPDKVMRELQAEAGVMARMRHPK